TRRAMGPGGTAVRVRSDSHAGAAGARRHRDGTAGAREGNRRLGCIAVVWYPVPLRHAGSEAVRVHDPAPEFRAVHRRWSRLNNDPFCADNYREPDTLSAEHRKEHASMTTPNPYAPPQARVADVVDPRQRHVDAERGTRLAAAILDGLIFGAMVYVPFLAGTIAGAITAGPQPGGPGFTAGMRGRIVIGLIGLAAR